MLTSHFIALFRQQCRAWAEFYYIRRHLNLPNFYYWTYIETGVWTFSAPHFDIDIFLSMQKWITRKRYMIATMATFNSETLWSFTMEIETSLTKLLVIWRCEPLAKVHNISSENSDVWQYQVIMGTGDP